MAVADAALTLAADDFTLFGVPKRFAQDRAKLDARWKELQREAHPDRFAAQSAAAQRQALQWSVRINEAYQRLKDPLRRAAYLCELAGAPINAHDNTAMPAAFLMQQMAWREALEDARQEEQVQALHDEVMQTRNDLLARCEEMLDGANDAVQAVAQVRSLMFIDKFCADIDTVFETLQSHSTPSAKSRTTSGSD
jgi:molecular chaperone HscB